MSSAIELWGKGSSNITTVRRVYAPYGVRPYKSQRGLPLHQITAWEIDSHGETDEHGVPLRRLRKKVTGTLAKAIVQRRAWLLTLTAKGDVVGDGTPPLRRRGSALKRGAPKGRPPVRADMTLREYVEGGPYSDWSEKKAATSTIYTRVRQFRSRILPVLGDRTLPECNTPQAQELLRASLDATRRKRKGKSEPQPLSVGYKNLVLVTFGGVMKIAADPYRNDGIALIERRLPVEEYREDVDPEQMTDFADGVEWGIYRHKRYSDEELRRAWDLCEDDWDRVMMGLGLFTGCRISESCARTWEDCLWKEERLWIRNQVLAPTNTTPARLGPTKNRLTGRIPMPGQLLEALRGLKKNATSEYILGAGHGRPFMSRGELAPHWIRLARKANLSKETYHGLRHSYCSRLADNDFAPQEIQRLARHRKIATTFGYIQPKDAALQRAGLLVL